MANQPRSPVIHLIWQLSAFTGLTLLGTFGALVVAVIVPPLAVVTLPLAGAFAILIVSRFLARKFEQLPVRAIGIGFDRPWVRQLLGGLLLGGALIMTVWMVFRLTGWGATKWNPDHSGQIVRLIGFVLLSLALALYEELLCRGYAFQVIARRSVPAAMILGGLLFVALHIPNEGGKQPLVIINIFLAHLLFSVCYLRTRSLWLPIGLHISWNFVEAFVLGMPISGRVPKGTLFVTKLQTGLWTGQDFGPEGGLVVTTVFAAATIAIWLFFRQRHPSPDIIATEPVALRPPPDLPVVDRAAPMPELRPTVKPADRILAIDVLRGTAILGILPMNMQIIGMIDGAFLNPYAGDFTDATNVTIWVLLRVLIGHKDLTVFSILFGAGIAMIEASRRSLGEDPAAVHYRRMAFLLVFGLIHAYAIFTGDILFTYAVCGVVVYWLRGLKPGFLIPLGTLAYAVPMVLLFIAPYVISLLPPELMAAVNSVFQPTTEQIAEYNKIYGGSWLQQMTLRYPAALFLETIGLIFAMGWIAGGMMLVGLGLYKLGIFSAERPNRTYSMMIAAAALIGFPLVVFGIFYGFKHHWQMPYGVLRSWFFRECGQPVIAIGWIGAVMLICKYGKLKRVTAALAAVGRLALSNYLMCSVICSFIFHGHGLGLVGKVDLVGIVLISLVIWIAQLIASSLWLKHYRLGPIEWLWRSLTYGQFQPMRRAVRA